MRTAVYTGTRNVYADMAASCRSLLCHRGADRIVFLIEDDVFPEPLPECISCYNVSGQKYFRPDGPNFSKRWTYMTLMRAALPLMPEVSGRVLSLDIDTVICGSLDALWELPFGPLYMAREVGRSEEYYNAGVMLMDTGALIEDFGEIVTRINRQNYQFCEQDAINQVMRGRIRTLPAEYNVSNWTVAPDGDPKIFHYAAIRDWQHLPLWREYSEMSWTEALRGG